MLKNKLDEIDVKILNSLQRDAKLTNVELASKVGLSPSPCLARVKALTASRTIKRYVTLLDAEILGLKLNVYVQITLEKQSDNILRSFKKAVLSWNEVLECHLMTGDADYLLRVVVSDIEDLRRFILTRLTLLEGISNIRSSISLEQIKYETALPLRV